MKAAINAAVAAVMLAGCAVAPPQQRYASSVSFCNSKENCDAKWSRAVAWLNGNARTRIRMMNDTLIETFEGQNPRYLAYRLTRVTSGAGAQITVEAGCRFEFGCDADQHADDRLGDLLRAMDSL